MLMEKEIEVVEAKTPPLQQMQIGLVGLGRMGRVFGRLLLAAGAKVMAYDRHPDQVRSLVVEGAVAASGFDDFSECDAVVTSLPDDDAVRSVVLAEGGLASFLRPGAIHLSTSTIGVAFCKELDSAHRKLDQQLVAMPVLGNPDLAARRELFILLGGPAAAITKTRALVDELGQHSFYLGEEPWLASGMKLAANMLTAATLQSMGEAFAFLAKLGVAPARAQEVLTGSLFDGRVHKAYGGKIVGRQYTPGMTVPLATKDLRLLLAEAERSAVPMPVAGLLHDRLVAAQARGWSHLDWSVLGRLAAFEAGIAEEE